MIKQIFEAVKDFSKDELLARSKDYIEQHNGKNLSNDIYAYALELLQLREELDNQSGCTDTFTKVVDTLSDKLVSALISNDHDKLNINMVLHDKNTDVDYIPNELLLLANHSDYQYCTIPTTTSFQYKDDDVQFSLNTHHLSYLVGNLVNGNYPKIKTEEQANKLINAIEVNEISPIEYIYPFNTSLHQIFSNIQIDQISIDGDGNKISLDSSILDKITDKLNHSVSYYVLNNYQLFYGSEEMSEKADEKLQVSTFSGFTHLYWNDMIATNVVEHKLDYSNIPTQNIHIQCDIVDLYKKHFKHDCHLDINKMNNSPRM